MSRLEGAALGIGGFTGGGRLVALGWIQSRMVFYSAAGYDQATRCGPPSSST